MKKRLVLLSILAMIMITIWGCGGGSGGGPVSAGNNAPAAVEVTSEPTPTPPIVSEPTPTPTSEPTPTPTPTPTPENPTPIQNPAKTLVEINTVTGQIDITPIFEGDKIINLVDSNPTEIVLDANNQVIPGYRIAWNDTGDWYPTGGKIMPLLLNKTTFLNATRPVGTGSGMPYLIKPDGSFIPFNTDSDQCIFKVDGVPIGAWGNGLIQY